jgi:hypothetical protein
LGRNIAANVPGTLPNCESVLRNTTELQRGVVIEKVWPGFGVCKAKIISIDSAQSTLYPGQDVTVYTVKYEGDNTREDLEESELRQLIVVSDQLARSTIPSGLQASPPPAP